MMSFDAAEGAVLDRIEQARGRRDVEPGVLAGLAMALSAVQAARKAHRVVQHAERVERLDRAELTGAAARS